MAEPFLGEIRLFSFLFPPKGWAFCNGQLLPINQNQALFAILGTTYGGNGTTTFALPNLQGRAPIHFGSGFTLGQFGGTEAETITLQTLAGHTHLASASETATSPDPLHGVPAKQPGRAPVAVFAGTTDGTVMNAGMVSTTGGSQPHNNMQPSAVISYCIALLGIFPSQN